MTAETVEGAPRVLIVEDEPDLADLYADYLRGDYEVQVAYGGEEGLDLLSDEYDVVVLDRRMPVVSGNEVLAAMSERDLDPRVALVTAVNPDFDIIDLAIDDYLVKPITRQELRETVEWLLTIDEYNERAQELTSKKLKRNVLKLEKTTTELENSERFTDLRAEIDELEAEVERIADDLRADDLERYI